MEMPGLGEPVGEGASTQDKAALAFRVVDGEFENPALRRVSEYNPEILLEKAGNTPSKS